MGSCPAVPWIPAFAGIHGVFNTAYSVKYMIDIVIKINM